MKRNWRLVVVGIFVLLAVLVGLFAGVVAVESGTTVESTVVTSQAGTVSGTGSDLVLAVRGDSRFASSVTERLSARLDESGYSVRVVDSLESTYEASVLVVNVTRADVRGGIISHRATLAVETYYATDWNATDHDAYRETGTVELRDSGTAVANGEFRIDDRTRGFPGNYRSQLTDEIVDVVAENFRGEIPR